MKYLSNAYHAVKLAFANEAGAVLATYGVDAREAFRLFCEDRTLNISPAYLRPGFAFGGSCLPKDMRSLLALADHGHDVAAPFLGSVMPSNEAVVTRVFDSHQRRHPRQPDRAVRPGLQAGHGRHARIALRHAWPSACWAAAGICASSTAMWRPPGCSAPTAPSSSARSRIWTACWSPTVASRRWRARGLVVLGHIGAEDRAALLDSLTDQVVIDLAGLPILQQRLGITYQGLCW